MIFRKLGALRIRLVVAVIGIGGCHLPVSAAIFGDGDPENGYEDQRQTGYSGASWPGAFRSLGLIKCAGFVRGAGVLIRGGTSSGASGTYIGSSTPEALEEYPVVLTASHLLDEVYNSKSGCVFESQTPAIRQTEIKADDIVRGPSVSSVAPVRRFASDWALVRLNPWSHWRMGAIQLSWQPIEEMAAIGQLPAALVSYDQVAGRIVAHQGCRMGSASDSRLLDGQDGILLWDNCDSLPGGSGGALFVEREGRHELAGFRVGQLYDADRYPQAPPLGEKFDLQLNINVGRLLDNRLLDLLHRMRSVTAVRDVTDTHEM